MLEIILHDGPARLGKYGKGKTPAISKPDTAIPIINDEPMPYDVPRALAEWSVQRTLENAKKSGKKGLVVVHGSKYLDLRIQCAKKLDELGYTAFMIANSEQLLKKPRDLVDIVVNIRETLNPNSALYFPFVNPIFVPLLAYMGVDLFGDFVCDFYAYQNIMLTPTTKYDLEKYQIFDFSLKELKKYNTNVLDFVIREVRENIKNGTLRNLVESRCCALPETMSALRILDKKYPTFLEKYTPIH